MSKVSVNILTKDRAGLLPLALQSIVEQSLKDVEVVVVNDGSVDQTPIVLEEYEKKLKLKVINHQSSLGITKSREIALTISTGDYVAILDDDDVWIDIKKLAKQVKFLDQHKDCVLVGGGIRVPNFHSPMPEQIVNPNSQAEKFRPETDSVIRKTMLIRNNFFTSTVMFRKSAAMKAGGFMKDGEDFAEDYDLWLRLGQKGKMYNFQEAFAEYRVPTYNSERKIAFLKKQLRLINREKAHYPNFWLASLFLKLRTL